MMLQAGGTASHHAFARQKKGTRHSRPSRLCVHASSQQQESSVTTKSGGRMTYRKVVCHAGSLGACKSTYSTLSGHTDRRIKAQHTPQHGHTHSLRRPESFAAMVDDAAGSVKEGIAAGLQKMEVDFPPVPTQLDSEWSCMN